MARSVVIDRLVMPPNAAGVHPEPFFKDESLFEFEHPKERVFCDKRVRGDLPRSCHKCDSLDEEKLSSKLFDADLIEFVSEH